jgi:phosphoribosylformylglycinamidine synthase
MSKPVATQAAIATTDEAPTYSPQVLRGLGLKVDEYERILELLGRAPNFTELAVFGALWSEHCSYKSSKKYLKTLPTSAPWVIQGPGENAGVIDIGDGLAAVFKIESHNHPSFIEPYQGSATGVGGILRDVFTMGARPIALLNALRFGDPSHAKTRSLVAGVVAGIGGYGNCVGVPTVGGECQFHACYNGNNLVNAMAVGIAQADKIFYAKAAGIGNPVVYVGAKTGRDGVHGATMASAAFSASEQASRPTVQVGDPFKEKLLIEACLELMNEDAIIAIQDMGAAGLTSSACEMASKGGIGIHLDLSAVPLREADLQPYEIMLSESQERMLMVLKPEATAKAQAIFAKWDLDAVVVGSLIAEPVLEMQWHGESAGVIPIAALVDEAPQYDRPVAALASPSQQPVTLTKPVAILPALQQLLASPNLASKRWIWQQYDRHVGVNSLSDSGAATASDAAVVRVAGTHKALAMATDCNPFYGAADPYIGGAQAVVESWRNLVASGAKPLALTNNLNFGNPEKSEIMAQLKAAVTGIGDAARALDFPVVSGNVSLYNDTDGVGIYPTPVIGGVGLLADYSQRLSMALTQSGLSLVQLGSGGSEGWLGRSQYLMTVEGQEAGAPPPVDFATERRVGELVLALNQQQLLAACHDISDGGLLVALAEMWLTGAGRDVGTDQPLGIQLNPDLPASDAGFWFGEDQARYLIATLHPDQVLAAAAEAGVPALLLGQTTAVAAGAAAGDTSGKTAGKLTLPDGQFIARAALQTAHEAWLPTYMQG